MSVTDSLNSHLGDHYSSPFCESPLSRSTAKPKESDPLLKVKAEVDEVKGIMHQNIEKVIERGDRIEDLQANSGQLSPSHCSLFRILTFLPSLLLIAIAFSLSFSLSSSSFIKSWQLCDFLFASFFQRPLRTVRPPSRGPASRCTSKCTGRTSSSPS